MSSRTALPSSKKTHSEKHKQILKQLLRESANKSCADCKVTKNPRWASWSLGCFVCIRCSGIHRSMGTHISKVKSVDLDAWTDDQIENMVKWGNEKSNIFWEAKLPEGYTPDQSKIESFIRTKYDIKKWAASTTIPNPLTIKVNNPTSVNTSSTAISSTSSSSTSVPTSIKAPQPKSANLLDDDFGAFTSSPSSTPTPQPTNLIPQPISASVPPPSNSVPVQPIIQSAQSTGGSIASNGRPDLKKSILSLYSSPSSSTGFLQPQQSSRNQSYSPSFHNTSSAITPNVNNSTSINSLSNSLNGLQFSGSTINSNKPTPPLPSDNIASSTNSFNSLAGTSFNVKPVAPNVAASNSWRNEWNDSSSSLKNQWNEPSKPTSNVGVNGLDDELFKNVWN
ncbi:zinc finger protein [Scheffersomyces amazonensis]|uniref:zinc finger protein n=1 Tax=Scheffersomyces amazonensis TaxID=1078765 RepID=UPI00315DA5AA